MPKAKGPNKAVSHSRAKAATKESPAPPALPPPAWPLFKRSSWQILEPEPMLDDRVLLIRNFWPKALCRDYVAFLRTLPLATTPGRPKRGEAVRVNDRFQVQDQAFADRLWTETGLKDALIGEEWKALW